MNGMQDDYQCGYQPGYSAAYQPGYPTGYQSGYSTTFQTAPQVIQRTALLSSTSQNAASSLPDRPATRVARLVMPHV